jgi:hypothetical protein
MYNINMYGGTNWWYQQQQNKKPTKCKFVAPNACIFCSKRIDEGDFFYVGYDEHNIYAETCDNLRCHTWLVKKGRFRKAQGKDYEKEAKERYEKD